MTIDPLIAIIGGSVGLRVDCGLVLVNRLRFSGVIVASVEHNNGYESAKADHCSADQQIGH